MFHIKLVPTVMDGELTVTKDGEILIINDIAEDFSGLEDGEFVSFEDISGDDIVGQRVARIDGVVHLSLRLPRPSIDPRFRETPAARAVRFPEPITVLEDGPVDLPKWVDPEPDAELEAAP